MKNGMNKLIKIKFKKEKIQFRKDAPRNVEE